MLLGSGAGRREPRTSLPAKYSREPEDVVLPLQTTELLGKGEEPSSWFFRKVMRLKLKVLFARSANYDQWGISVVGVLPATSSGK